MSTFSKGNKTRKTKCFAKIDKDLISKVKRKHSSSGRVAFPVDFTVITLTSKLLCQEGYHQ
ncbi:MAG: IS4 family transposase, partial [Thermosynechococcus sp. Uc]|nr:IS4 family transposase [Thermosynechococcus sp. Uc]